MTIRDDVAASLGAAYTGALHDALRGLDQQGQMLPAGISPLGAADRLHGPAFVIEGRVDRARTDYEVLDQWTSLLAQVPPGSVVVCQPNDATFAHMGELSARTLQLRGVRGYIVDGGCRDCDAVAQLGFPVWARYRTPAAGPWLCEAAAGTVTIGSAEVGNGDYVVADGDGVIVVPSAVAVEVAEAVAAVVDDEARVRDDLMAGDDPSTVFRRHGRF